jgi:hypothetical protein
MPARDIYRSTMAACPSSDRNEQIITVGRRIGVKAGADAAKAILQRPERRRIVAKLFRPFQGLALRDPLGSVLQVCAHISSTFHRLFHNCCQIT